MGCSSSARVVNICEMLYCHYVPVALHTGYFSSASLTIFDQNSTYMECECNVTVRCLSIRYEPTRHINSHLGNLIVRNANRWYLISFVHLSTLIYIYSCKYSRIVSMFFIPLFSILMSLASIW